MLQGLRTAVLFNSLALLEAGLSHVLMSGQKAERPTHKAEQLSANHEKHRGTSGTSSIKLGHDFSGHF